MERKSVFSSFVWRLMERVGAQGVGFVVSIILARLLDPSAYGTIALVTVFISILRVFVDSGLGTALVQKKDADELDFSTVFVFNTIICMAIYALLFLGAPVIAGFYNNEQLIAVVRVTSLGIVFAGIKGIQQSYVSRNMIFKKSFFSTLIGTSVSALFGIFMAYRGFGVWALVAQYVLGEAIDTLVLWMTVPCRPNWAFSTNRFKALFGYGWKLLAARLISTVYNNLRQLLIGKVYTSEDLAYYNKGHEFPNKIVPTIENSISNVLLPTVSREQDDMQTVRSITRRAIQAISYVIWPMMVGMAACGETLIKLLLTDKWLPCVIYLQIFCIEAAFWPICSVYNNTMNALGKVGINLKVQFTVRGIGIFLMLILMKQGPVYLAISAFAVTFIELVIVAVLIKYLIGYPLWQQLLDLLQPLLLSCFMGTVVLLIGRMQIGSIALLAVQVIAGVVIYALGSVVFRIAGFQYILNLVRRLHKKRVEEN